MPRWFRVLVPVMAAVVALGAGTAAAAKIVNGRSLKNGTVTEKKLSPAVRKKLNAPGPQGPQGPQGVPGNPAPAGRTAVAVTDAIDPLALDATAVVLALGSAEGTGLLTVDGPSRLLITAQVNASKTSSDFSKNSRVACQILHEDLVGREPVGRRVEASMAPVASGSVLVSLALVGSVDVQPGAHDVSVQCEALAAPPANAGVSFLSASVNVDAVPL